MSIMTDTGVNQGAKAGMDRYEFASRDEIVAMQTERLAWSLRHSYANVPSFRAKCEAKGVHPDDFKELKDLALFPFTVKDDLRQAYPFGMFAVPMEDIVRVHASSGTTGRPTVVGYTKGDIDVWAEVVARSIRAAGGTRGDRVHIAYGYGLFTGGLGAHYGAERLGCTVIPMSGGQTEKQVQLIQDFKPTIIMVTPSYMLNIADEMRRQGIDPRSTSLRVGIFGAEPWTGALREEIERTFNIHAVDIYGLSEVMGPGVASECVETKDGPVIWEDHFYPEIIDPETGEVLPDGSYGELVFTTLTKQGMPVIRYRTRDLTRLLPPTARGMRRMDKITGRSDDMLIIRGVNVFPTQVEELICKIPALAPHYELVVSRDGHMDNLAVRVEMHEDIHPSEWDGHAKHLQHSIKSLIGISTRVEVVEPGGIARSIGKAKRVQDLRPKA
ncbi:phenylacetate--CoA ligase PaaK [Azospirillum sp. Sh1]|uniref:phenylacetate--CoA ligase PaaK n=1 Tax=Azospirillum sp. Sh1 TaxID=2607285 RepID=UPI00165D37A6|nr:phenylacetate--CoA ligase PaaK [Azospirillum sp. Sh1]